MTKYIKILPDGDRDDTPRFACNVEGTIFVKNQKK